MTEPEVDPCAGCQRPDVTDGDDVSAHWLTPASAVIAAWSCSARCSAIVESKRGLDGLLLA